MRVLDWTHVRAGPFAGYMLGQMGADVIRFERIDQPEMIRNNSLDPLLAPLGLGEGFVMQGSGKRSIGGDIRDPDVKAAIHALLATVDVLVENFRPGKLAALVSVVSITVALGAMPIALWADRRSRVKSIVIMATLWSVATISCMFTRNYGQLLAARALVGVGEAGYGSVGSALIASHFPARMRGMLMAIFFSAGSFGSVLGVMLGGVIASHWGWKAAFGVVGVPGLVMALLYIFVRDYRTVELTPRLDKATQNTGNVVRAIVGAMTRSPTMLWVCLGGSAQVIVLSTVWAWLPSYLNRTQGAESGNFLKTLDGLLAGGSDFYESVADELGIDRTVLTAAQPKSKLSPPLLATSPLSWSMRARVC